ncbi:hypothetical protein GCM10022419_057360 [Nonomuraea rosea]|uniref:Uncharacterized protein n=1 Tax=Nonomuraea rosea TaxID=638574 RepID=A0ABP6XMK2_9ACTN
MASALAGISILLDRNEPTAHDTEANSTTTIPTLLPPSAPVSDRAATPTSPTSTPASVRVLGRSRTTNLNTTSHSGTEATRSAARPVEMYCSATASSPLPVVSSSTPTTAAPRNCLRDSLKAAGPDRTSRKPESSAAAVMNRMAALSIGGIDSIAIPIPRYVEPHTT